MEGNNNTPQDNFVYEDRIDPKTGLMRQYKVYKDVQYKSRRYVGIDEKTQRDVTREVIRTPGQPWMLLENFQDGAVLSDRTWMFLGVDFIEDFEKFPLPDLTIEKSNFFDAYEGMKASDIAKDINEYAATRLIGSEFDFFELDFHASLPVSFTTQFEDATTYRLVAGPEHHTDAIMDVNLVAQIYPLDEKVPVIFAIDDKALGFREMRVIFNAKKEDLGTIRSPETVLELVNGWIDLETRAIHIHDWEVYDENSFDKIEPIMSANHRRHEENMVDRVNDALIRSLFSRTNLNMKELDDDNK